MKALLFFILSFIACFQTSSLFAQTNENELSAEAKDRLRQIEAQKDKLTTGLFTPITFYGKVIDQFGHSVSGVDVWVGIDVFSPNPILFFKDHKTERTTTDSEGCFIYKGTGRCINIGFKMPKGYIYSSSNNIDKFHYAQEPETSPVKLHVPDKDNPVIFKVRKKEKAEVISSYMTIWKFENGGKYYLDIFKEEYLSENDIQKSSDKYQRLANGFRYCLKLDLSEKKEADSFIYSIKVSAPELLKLRKFENKQAELLKLPESGYDQTELLYEYKTRKQVDGMRSVFINSTFARSIEFEPGNEANVMAFGKINDQYYAKIFVYRITPGGSFVHVLVNSTPNNSIFEDDKDLRRELGNQKVKEIENKVAAEFHSKFPLLKDIIEAEKAKTPEPTK